MLNLATQVTKFYDEKPPYPDHILDLLGEAEALKIAGESEKAIKIIQNVLCEEPECLIAYEQIADNYLILNDTKKAVKASNFALSLNAESCLANYVLGFIKLQELKWDDAYVYLTKADSALPNNPEILRCLGWTLFKKGKCTKGIILLERVLTMVPEDPVALCDLGICYFELKIFEKALEFFARASEVDPESERATEMMKVAESVVANLSKYHKDKL